MAMMICKGCGQEIHETAAFCPHCGYNYTFGAGVPGAGVPPMGNGTGFSPGAPPLEFAEAVRSCFTQYAQFHGRAARSEFWYFVLCNFLVSLAAGVIDNSFTGEKVFQGLVSIAFFLPMIAVTTRRLHDMGRSGWWQLLGLTGIGIILLIIWYCQPAKTQNNAYANA